MECVEEKESDCRVPYLWPAWFGYQDNGEFMQGQINDASRSTVNITVKEHQCPNPGDHLLTRFSYPISTSKNFDMGSYYYWAEVVQIDHALPGLRKVALRLHKPLEHEPAQPE